MAELQPVDYATPSTEEHIIKGIAVVTEVTGAKVPPNRQAAIAETLVRSGFTRAMLTEAVERMKVDIEFNRKLSFGRPITAADFFDMVETDTAVSRLHTYHEMLQICSKTGEPMENFTAVKVEGRDKPLWRRRV